MQGETKSEPGKITLVAKWLTRENQRNMDGSLKKWLPRYFLTL